MRLTVLDRGHRRRVRLFLAAVRRLSGVDMPDVVTMLLYRPEFFGRPMLDLTAHAMRGPSYWTAGEREFLAADTARRFRLPFCVDTHTELTRIASHGELDADDPVAARPELVAAADFLAVVSFEPDRVGPAPDLPKRVLREALHVNLVWNIVNRLGLAFGFELREGQLRAGTRALHRVGYRMPRLLIGRRLVAGDRVENLRHAVFDGPGVTSAADRAAAGTGGPLAEPWRTYAAAVRDSPDRITDADVERLRAGHGEDAIFEITTAAAVGAALRSLEAGLRAG
ncbi:MAG: hypothetical protein ACRDSK_16945 [Actinophytocola sp.]|uniref:hypothetical protein n=1 Tax=Actinophytocola sp. TaxID=1872138 RepID=UPI003D6B83D8